MNNIVILILTIVFIFTCVVGQIASKMIKDEETLYGFNAIVIAFLIGFITSGLIVFIFNN